MDTVARRRRIIVIVCAAVLVVAVAGFGWVIYDKYQAAQTADRTPMLVQLDLNVTPAQTEAVAAFLRTVPRYGEVLYRDKAAAEAYRRQTFKDAPELLSLIQPGSIPAEFQLTLKHKRDAVGVANHLGNMGGVGDIITPAGIHRT